MRVTTGSLSRGYNNRLNRVLSNLNLSNEKVTTRRQYLRASENPAQSVRAKRLEREMTDTEDYLNNVKSVLDTYQSAESSMMEISTAADGVYTSILQALNAPVNQEQRDIIAKDIEGKQEAIVASLNSRFEQKFLFGGSGTKELPFALENGKLTFRGIDVDAAPGSADYDELKKMSEETLFVDLGFGLKVDNNNQVQNTTAFNVSIPGLKLVGFGTDANGRTNNLVNTLGELAKELRKEPLDQATTKIYSDKLNDQRTNLLVNITQMGSSSIFLNSTKSRLESNEAILNEKINSIEFGEYPELILDFTEQNYVYQAALKMGTKVLSNSFIDYMN